MVGIKSAKKGHVNGHGIRSAGCVEPGKTEAHGDAFSVLCGVPSGLAVMIKASYIEIDCNPIVMGILSIRFMN
jgi:hypothetical protein